MTRARPLLAALLAAPAAAAAPALTVIHSFAPAAVGYDAPGPLVADKAGNLYGVVERDISNANGLVFELSPPAAGGSDWTYQVLWSFSGPDGQQPEGKLAFDDAGNLLGVTTGGGANGAGTVFELSPNGQGGWSETVLYSFTDKADGYAPGSGLTKDASGDFYGVIYSGPYALYRMTPSAGSYTYEQVLTANRQLLPVTMLLDSGGLVLPQAFRPNWGVVRLAPLGPTATPHLARLFGFAGGAQGCDSGAGLTEDPAHTLYGVTFKCGLGANLGTVFAAAPPATAGNPWTVSVLHAFAGGRDGYGPENTPVRDASGRLYGTTVTGGANRDGTIWELTPPAVAGGSWAYRHLHEFTNSVDGRSPTSDLLLAPDGNLYGSTSFGGPAGGGVIFQQTR